MEIGASARQVKTMVSTKYKKHFQKMEFKKFGIFHPKWSEPLEKFPTRQKAAEALINAFEHRSKNCMCIDCLESGIDDPNACVILPVA